jgi:hypothetical protein
MNLYRISFYLLLFVQFSYSQRNDFIISDSARRPYFEFDDSSMVNIVWQSGHRNDQGVYYGILDSQGIVKSVPYRISQTLSGSRPRLFVTNQQVLFIWSDFLSTNISFFVSYIKAKILQRGTGITKEIQVDDGDTIPNNVYRYEPEMIRNNDTTLFIVWYGGGSRSLTGNYDVYLKKVLTSPSFARATTFDTTINNSFVNTMEYFPSAYHRPSGNGYLVLWNERDPVKTWSIVGTLCDQEMRAVSPKMVFRSYTAPLYDWIERPLALYRSNGNFLLVWKTDTTNYRSTVFLQEFTESGAAVGEPQTVNEQAADGTISVAIDADEQGRFIIMWEDGKNLIAQRFSADLNRIGTNFRVNTTSTTKTSLYPHVRLRNGKIYTAWERGLSVWMNIRDFNNPLSVSEHITVAPQSFELYQNHPNPFNPTTSIEYEIPHGGEIVISVHDILGRTIKSQRVEKPGAGRYRYSFEASHLVSGIYFYRLSFDGIIKTKRMILLK